MSTNISAFCHEFTSAVVRFLIRGMAVGRWAVVAVIGILLYLAEVESLVHKVGTDKLY